MQAGLEGRLLGAACGFKASQVHVVGLGGVGIRGLVPILQARGAKVTGSDLFESPELETLRGRGVVCSVGHSDSNLDPSTDLVLVSAAIRQDNPEVVAAVRKHIAILKYAECLGYLMREKQGIAVAGTHGKTTTTAMVAYVLVRSGLDPSFVIGGDYPGLGGSSRSGRGRHFVAEACEFDRSFHKLFPRAAVVTNVEEEHLDYFRSLDEIQDAFAEFVRLLPEDGFLTYNLDDPKSEFLSRASRARVQGFSLKSRTAPWRAEGLTFVGPGYRFQIRGPRRRPVVVQLRVPGLHNVRNALACAAVCSSVGVPVSRAAEALSEFTGVRRRFDILLREPVTVIDDYAHHPTEVETVIQSARQVFAGRKLVCVFQPHQHSRLRSLLDGFAGVLRTSDETLVTRVYRCRDSDADAQAIESGALVEAVRARGGLCRYTPEYEHVLEALDQAALDGSVVAFLGAGTVTEFAKSFAERRGGRLLVAPRPVWCPGGEARSACS